MTGLPICEQCGETVLPRPMFYAKAYIPKRFCDESCRSKWIAAHHKLTPAERRERALNAYNRRLAVLLVREFPNE